VCKQFAHSGGHKFTPGMLAIEYAWPHARDVDYLPVDERGLSVRDFALQLEAVLGITDANKHRRADGRATSLVVEELLPPHRRLPPDTRLKPGQHPLIQVRRVQHTCRVLPTVDASRNSNLDDALTSGACDIWVTVAHACLAVGSTGHGGTALAPRKFLQSVCVRPDLATDLSRAAALLRDMVEECPSTARIHTDVPGLAQGLHDRGLPCVWVPCSTPCIMALRRECGAHAGRAGPHTRPRTPTPARRQAEPRPARAGRPQREDAAL